MAPLAMITGGSRGIGAATARKMATDGWDIALTYRSAADEAAAIVKECEAMGRRATAVQCDVSVEADVTTYFEQVTEQLGVLSAFVANAGIVAPPSTVTELTSARVERMFAVNVYGAIYGAREAAKLMSTELGGSGGSIVFVSSSAARTGGANQYVDYAASKGAIDTFTVGMALELADKGVRVNAVRPGVTRTEIHASGGQPDRAAQLGPSIPMKRAGEPDEIANAIAWLASPESSYVTGSILDVSGGR